MGYGTGFKLGFTHRFSRKFTVGGSFHSRTWISDIETSKAVLSFSGTGDAFPEGNAVEVTGTMKVRNFEWPAVFRRFRLLPIRSLDDRGRCQTPRLVFGNGEVLDILHC